MLTRSFYWRKSSGFSVRKRRMMDQTMGDSTHSPAPKELQVLLERLKESPLHKLTKHVESNVSNILPSHAPDKHLD